MGSVIQNIAGFSSRSAFAKLGNGYTGNMYVETKSSDEHTFERVLLPMPGYVEKFSLPGAPRGSSVVLNGYGGKPRLYFVFGRTLYVDGDVGPVSLGDVVSPGDSDVSFAESSGYGGTHPHLFVADGVNVLSVDLTLNPAMQRLDIHPVPLPLRSYDGSERIEPVCACYSNGYLVVLDRGSDRFFSSCQFPYSDGSDDVFMVSEAPSEGNERPYYRVGYFNYGEYRGDETLAVIPNHNRILAIGRASLQSFGYNQVSLTRNYLGGNVWTCGDGAAISVGCSNGRTVATVAGRTMFVGSVDGGNIQVLSVGANLDVDVVSTPELERSMSRYDVRSAYAFAMQWMQHPFYVVTFPTDGVTMAYDLREGGWVNLSSGDSHYRYKNAVNLDGRLLLQGDGVMVEASVDTWNDRGEPVVRKRCGSCWSVDGSDFVVNELGIITNNGDFDVDGGANVMMRYSTDGKTWHDTFVKSLGFVGQYAYDTEFYDLGEARYLSVELSCSDDVPFAIYGVKLDVERCVY